MNLIYQNNETGKIYDISSLVSGLTWTTKRAGEPATLEISALVHEDIVWNHGGILSLRTAPNGAALFYGYVFKQSYKAGSVTITAYDQLRYLKNKATYVLEGKRADQVLERIAADFKLKTGKLANTGYVIPSMVEDGQTLFDIVLKALDHTMVHAGKMYCLWDDFGALRITDVSDNKLMLVVGDGSLATEYTYDTEIDSETYNRIKLVRDNQQTGKRDLWQFQDSDTMKLWGILQDYQTVDENMTEAQIKERGEKMLELYNRPKKSFKIEALADLSVRAGRLLFILIEALAIKQYFLVEEVAHDLIKGTMSLTLKAV